LKVETGFKIKSTPQFQDWRDKKYFSPQNQFVLESCHALQLCENVNLENHIECTYFLFGNLSFYPYNIQSISIHQEKKRLFQSSELQPWKNFRNPEFWIL